MNRKQWTEEADGHDPKKSVINARQSSDSSQSVCSANPFYGITKKDVRDAVLKVSRLPRIEYLRVSDGWWIAIEDGKPTNSIQHAELMEIIRHNCEPSPNAELRRGHHEQQ